MAAITGGVRPREPNARGRGSVQVESQRERHLAQRAATMAGNLRHDDRGVPAIAFTRMPLRIDLSATWSVDMKACASVLFVPDAYRSMPPRARPVSFCVFRARRSCTRRSCNRTPWNSTRACSKRKREPDSSSRCERSIRGGGKDSKVEYVRTVHSARRTARVTIPPPGDGNVFPTARTTRGNHGI